MGHARQWFVDFIQIYDGRKVRGGEGGSAKGEEEEEEGRGEGGQRTIPRGRKSVSRHSGAVVGIDCVFILDPLLCVFVFRRPLRCASLPSH